MNHALSEARQATADVPAGARERVWRRLQQPAVRATPTWVKGLAFAACTAAGFVAVSSFTAKPPPYTLEASAPTTRLADGTVVLGEGRAQISARAGVKVQARTHRIEAEVAVFSVGVAAAEVSVDVQDGEVRVDGERVLAGKRWPSEERAWTQAEESARAGDYPKAVQRFEALSGGGLRAEAALLRKGELELRELSSPAEALKTFDVGLKRFPKGSLTQELALSSLEATLALGQWHDARSRAAQFLARFPQSERLDDVRYVSALAAWQLNDRSTTCAEIRTLQTTAFHGERRATLEKLAAQCTLFER